MTTTTYPTKIGLELIIPLVLMFGASSALLIYHEAWIGLLINMTAVVGVCYISLNTHYTIEGDVLCIRSPLITPMVIEIQDISKVKETRDPMSSPAGSLDRLEICFGNNERVLISPKCKKEFILQLRTLNPAIEFELKRQYI